MSEDALIAQLKELNERSRTYGRQFWQVPFAYVAGAGVALVQTTDKPAALEMALLIIAAIGGFAAWHLAHLYRAARRAFNAICDVETKLNLPPTATKWTPGHLIAFLTMTSSVALVSWGVWLRLFCAERETLMLLPFWLQLGGLAAAFVGTVILALAYQAPSEMQKVNDHPIAAQMISGFAWRGALALVALGFLLQGSGLVCGAAR